MGGGGGGGRPETKLVAGKEPRSSENGGRSLFRASQKMCPMGFGGTVDGGDSAPFKNSWNDDV